jgi:hypothetical protein
MEGGRDNFNQALVWLQEIKEGVEKGPKEVNVSILFKVQDILKIFNDKMEKVGDGL